jgi:hypothetical protein
MIKKPVIFSLDMSDREPDIRPLTSRIKPMTSTLKNHPIWQNLNQTLNQLDPHQIAVQHLQDCSEQINGYWDDEEFYEVVAFTQSLHPQLNSSSLGISPSGDESNHWLKLKFALMINSGDGLDLLHGDVQTTVGELILILSESLEIIDENWMIDIHSPYVVATLG